MNDEDLIAIGVLAMLLLRDMPDWGGGWVWPVPDKGNNPGDRPLITNPFDRARHRGVDIMYRSPTGTYNAPVGTPIVAAKDGRVWSTGRTDRGYNVVLDHGPPFATFYQHLELVNVDRGQQVKAGDIIGQMGVDPTDPQGLRHLHFEAWWRGAGESAVDPAPMLAGARRVIWTA